MEVAGARGPSVEDKADPEGATTGGRGSLEAFVLLSPDDATEAQCAARLRQEIEKWQETWQALEADRRELRKAKADAEEQAHTLRAEAKARRARLQGRGPDPQDPGDTAAPPPGGADVQPPAPTPLPRLALLLPARPSSGPRGSDLHIRLPLLGGSALVTFEDPEVARQLLQQPEHEVQVEECRLRLRARALHLPAPAALQVSGRRCGRRALLSGLPTGLGLSDDQLLDKLELFFCKASRGGGEVAMRELLPGGRAAVLDFAEDGVVDRLCCVGWFEVPLGKRTVTLAVTPYLKGEVSGLELGCLRVPRTVLLSGVADVLEESALRDALELHFQRPTRGGGEVEALVYVAPGRLGYALFTPEIH
ncbi:interferon-induced 35 kDa protein [Tachyglossus aculeatus]|uniref:interferon-induced 35 kDa protein n=1 Tax=Tachyglossus aculeatus TaxID=9261 RepID=UPI0018F35774|nr:interferon-induced 35 kDa protein [Tachyglossus aculeatus]